MTIIKKVLSGLLISTLIISCSSPEQKTSDKKEEIRIVYTDWSESIAMTYLAQILLERDLDYDVVLKMADINTVFEEIAEGRADIFTDAWLPATHEEYLSKYKDNFEDLGANYKLARTGLVVPTYMEVNSIEQLKGSYNAPIAGIDSLAGIMINTRKAIQAYGLSNELQVLSDAEMADNLKEAVLRRENIVITGWEPHWIFHRYDLKYLEDPKEVFMTVEQIHTIARNGFKEDHPRAVEFFKRMALSEKQINSLLYEMKLNEEPLEGVKLWIKNNEFTVNQWTKNLGIERKKIM